MMAVEGPFLAAVIARLPDPKFNLAAYGVTFAIAILMEAPVIMLLSASTALVEDSATYRKLRNFMRALNAGATALLALILVPPVFDLLTERALGLPPEVTELMYGALLLILPWPAAIGYRRFLQGILIRSGRTRLVALGTVFRLVSMAATALALHAFGSLPGAMVGAAAMSVGVSVEAIATHFMAMAPIRDLKKSEGKVELGHRQIFDFYYPLALTSVIGLSLQPMLTFFMGRAPAPIESLAVFPVVHSLSFMFRALGLSYVDVVIALVGRRFEHFRELRRFAVLLALGTTLGLALIAFTPLAQLWFETVSGLSPELADFALTPTRILVLLPALSVLLYFLRGLFVVGRRTAPVTVSSAIEVAGVAVLFVGLGWGVGLIGVTAAFIAVVGGRAAGDVFLLWSTRRMLREVHEPPLGSVSETGGDRMSEAPRPH